MTHTCDNCNFVFEIIRHERCYKANRLMLVCGTGKNMIYKGDMNREYAMCPACGAVEHQLSAEARDQNEETSQ